ncbi:MAG: hypothetical protein HYY93_04965 [Planctomycetes bacterium]|nr:hypothetical protein [Planctomycetota bacterium]
MNSPNNDPVMAEIRQIRRDLDREAGGDVHKYFEGLREDQEKYKDRLVSVTPNRRALKTEPER